MNRIPMLLVLLTMLIFGCTITAIAQTPQAQANISWTDVTGETSYRVERADAGGPFTTVGTVAADVTNFVNAPLALNTQYCWRVIGEGTFGDGLPSPNACGTATTPGQVLGVQVILSRYP